MEKSMIFYSSYYQAIENTLDTPKEKYEVIKALAEYAFESKKPNYEAFSKPQRAIIIMALPLIDSAAKKKAGGKLGGRPTSDRKKEPSKAMEDSTPIYIPPDVEKRLKMKNIINQLRD